MNEVIYIAIDDTDIIGSTGTGRMARGLAEYLSSLGMGASMGITRHQLLVDERIPYTSHNSSLCIGFETTCSVVELTGPCVGYLNTNFREGADPGLCICPGGQIDDSIIGFGLRAQDTVLTKDAAIRLAAAGGIFLAELGGTGGGIIGALAGVGLRAEGNSGRFIELKGIRDINGLVAASELLARTDIHSVTDAGGKTVAAGEIIDSLNWIRPTLVRGKPVLRVRPEEASGKRVWFSLEKRHNKEKQKTER